YNSKGVATTNPATVNLKFTTAAAAATGASFVQQAAQAAPSGSSKGSATFSAATVAGDIILVGFDYKRTTVTGIADTQGNAFTEVGNELVSPGGAHTRVYYAKNIKGGADTITVTLAGGSPFAEVYATEYRGVDTASPIDARAGASGPAGN